MERRGLESERRTGSSLRREFDGAADAVLVRFEEEFSGRTRSADEASFRSRWRLRCGSSACSGGVCEASDFRDGFVDP